MIVLFFLTWLGGDLLQVEPADLVSPDRTPLLVAYGGRARWLVFRLAGVWLARRRNASFVRALRGLGPTSAPSDRPSGRDPDTDLDPTVCSIGSVGDRWSGAAARTGSVTSPGT